MHDIKLPQKLDEKSQEELLNNYIETKDIKVRDTLILHNLRLVKYISNRYKSLVNHLREEEDLFGEGVLGLMNAIETYDQEKGSFSSHAATYIQGSIRAYIRDKTQGLRVPAGVYEDLYKIITFRRDYSEVNGEEPTSEVISNALNIPKNRVEEYLMIEQNTTSLDTPISEEGETTTLGDMLEDERANFEGYILNIVFVNEFMDDMKDYLEPEEHEIIRLSLGLNCREHQMNEVARILDLSIEDVQNIKNQAFRKVRGSAYVEELYRERGDTRKNFRVHSIVTGSSDQFPYLPKSFRIL